MPFLSLLHCCHLFCHFCAFYAILRQGDTKKRHIVAFCVALLKGLKKSDTLSLFFVALLKKSDKSDQKRQFVSNWRVTRARNMTIRPGAQIVPFRAENGGRHLQPRKGSPFCLPTLRATLKLPNMEKVATWIVKDFILWLNFYRQLFVCAVVGRFWVMPFLVPLATIILCHLRFFGLLPCHFYVNQLRHYRFVSPSTTLSVQSKLGGPLCFAMIDHYFLEVFVSMCACVGLLWEVPRVSDLGRFGRHGETKVARLISAHRKVVTHHAIPCQIMAGVDHPPRPNMVPFVHVVGKVVNESFR